MLESHWGPVSWLYPTHAKFHVSVDDCASEAPADAIHTQWSSRRHRKQVAQRIVISSANSGPSVDKLKHITVDHKLGTWTRIKQHHVHSMSWWSVLCWNIGSHAYIYAGVCMFIPFFDSDNYVSVSSSAPR